MHHSYTYMAQQCTSVLRTYLAPHQRIADSMAQVLHLLLSRSDIIHADISYVPEPFLNNLEKEFAAFNERVRAIVVVLEKEGVTRSGSEQMCAAVQIQENWGPRSWSCR
jgi:hypothetical protein